MYVSIISSIIQAYAYTNTINTIFCHHNEIDGIVLPDGTDGPLRTHYGSRDDEIMVRLLKKRFSIVDYGTVPT